MGCCCDQNDDEDIQTHLLSSSSSSSFVSSADNLSTIISPMNSHFGALSCTDTLRLILSKLAVTDLARACCVCREDTADELAENIAEFVSSLPKSVRQTEEEHIPERIQMMFDKEQAGDHHHDHHHHSHGSHDHHHGHGNADYMDAYGLGNAWGH